MNSRFIRSIFTENLPLDGILSKNDLNEIPYSPYNSQFRLRIYFNTNI